MFWHKKEGVIEEKQGFFSKIFHKEESFKFQRSKAPILKANKKTPSIHPDVVAAAFKKVGVDVNKGVSPSPKIEDLQSNKELLDREASNFETLKKRTDFDLRERKRQLQEAESQTKKKANLIIKKEKELANKEAELKEKQDKLLAKESVINKKSHELEDLDITLKTKSKSSDVKQKEIEEEEAKLAKEKKVYFKEIDLLEKKREEIKHLERELKDEKGRYENKLEFMNKAFQYKLEKKEKDLKERWANIHKKEAAINIAEKEFETQKEEFEEKGFELFLEEETKGEHHLNAEKLEEMHEKLRIPELDQANLYKNITKCRELIKKHRVEQAKKLYNDVRNEFYNLDAKEIDKMTIKNTIRDLYDTINLATLGR